MGLAITVYETVEKALPEHEHTNKCYEQGHVYAFCYEGFEQSLRGLEPKTCYIAADGPKFGFPAGSYHGYGAFREALSVAALGVRPEVVWANPDEYRDREFYELIHFADNEGTIGPEAAAGLAYDFRTHRERVRDQLEDYFAAMYDRWQRAFEIAARGGLVEFR